MPAPKKKEVVIHSEEEEKLRDALAKKADAKSERLRRLLEMPDLSRTPGSPLAELAERIVGLPRFSEFEVLKVPEVVRYDISFDLFDFPPDHPVRKPTDTYFVDEDHILRTHTTVMWYYHLNLPQVRDKIKKGEPVGALSYGKVYRKDEIDRSHMPVFHQIDGWYLCRREEHVITAQDLQDVLVEMAKAIYGENVKYRFNADQFPYTDPSLEMEIEVEGRWIEVLGSGVVKGTVLKNFGVDPNVYNGWAFGPGLERLAMVSMDLPDIRLFWSDEPRIKRQLKLGQKYREVSKFPPITRDISFVVEKSFVPNDYFDLIRDLGGEKVEEVTLLDKYESEEKFGKDKVSYTYRIIYRSSERTLTNEEVEPIQQKIYQETAKQFKAELR